jgi:hypothetical protein
MQPGPQHGDVDFDKVYQDVVHGMLDCSSSNFAVSFVDGISSMKIFVPAGPAGGARAEQWAEQFDADELEDLDDYFKQAEEESKNAAFENAYSEAAPQGTHSDCLRMHEISCL